MNFNLKKILIVVGFIISVIIIGGALYYMFFAPEQQPEVITEEEGMAGELPGALEGSPEFELEDIDEEEAGLVEADEVAQGGLTQTTVLTTAEVFNTTIASDGQNVNYYDPNDGRFYTIDKDGNVIALSDKQFPEVESLDWNKDADKAVMEFPDGSNIVYDFENETQVTLPSHWEEFDFSPVKDDIAAKSIALDPNNRYLISTSANGSNVKNLQALGTNADKVQVNWSPNDQVVAFADTAGTISADLDRKMIIPVGKKGENFKGLIVEGLGFESKWSSNGKQLLYSVSGNYSQYKPLLWIVNASSSSMGENRRSLGLNTWIDKCTWGSSTTIYCAIPRGLPNNAGLQRSLYEDLPDTVYKINLTTGRSVAIAVPENDTSMKNLSVSKDESTLYFTSLATGQLEYIRLK